MLFWIAFALGCALGWMRAARRGGTTPDRIQYALAHGVPIGLAVLAASILYMRFSGAP